MPDNSVPHPPDVPSSGAVVQHGLPPLALLGSATDTDAVPPRISGSGDSERSELLEEIGRCGMGAIYRAQDRVLDRKWG